MEKISDRVYRYRDSCNVYVIRDGENAVLVDFGAGEVLEHLPEIGVTRVTDILMTHHHRDQGQGLPKAAALGIRIWVPHMEQDLFHSVNEHWQAREVYNSYNNRQDRFSLLASVPVFGTLKDYARHRIGSVEAEVVPTPGHTVGSITLLVQLDGISFAFTGDLIYAPGKVWSMAATQWTYNGAEGIRASILSLLDVNDRHPDMLLPSHGDPIRNPAQAIELLLDRFAEVLELQRRGSYETIMRLRETPFDYITPHLLWNKTSIFHSYVLLSNSGKALLIDYGYDFAVGTLAAGYDRAARRPWLYNLGWLKKKYGISKIDVVLPTHYHDDHVAGCNLLREAEGAQVWAAENFASLLECPSRYDMPCLWYDPIPVDRVVPLGRPFAWEEYEFTLYEQGGHTLYAAAISFAVDGKQVLAIGDQQDDEGNLWNYIYKNRFRMRDYVRSGELYLNLQPDMILSGHWDPVHVEPGYLERLKELGETLDRLHRQLLPLETINLEAEGFCARMYPYQQEAAPGDRIPIEVEVRNPALQEEEIKLELVVPDGWIAEEGTQRIRLPPETAQTVTFAIRLPAGAARRRASIGVDVTVGTVKLGQQAEALVTIRERESQNGGQPAQ